MAPYIGWTAVALAAASATAVLLTRDWRWNLGFMAGQYLAASALASLHWPIGMAAAFLVTGWMSIAALGMTFTTIPPQLNAAETAWPEGRSFRLFMAAMILVLAMGITPRVERAVAGIEAPVISGAVILTGIGLLQLGTSGRIGRIVLGLLTVLTGFEVFYAAVEGSILVAGLLSVVTLGLGLVGAYLLSGALQEGNP